MTTPLFQKYQQEFDKIINNDKHSFEDKIYDISQWLINSWISDSRFGESSGAKHEIRMKILYTWLSNLVDPSKVMVEQL